MISPGCLVLDTQYRTNIAYSQDTTTYTYIDKGYLENLEDPGAFFPLTVYPFKKRINKYYYQSNLQLNYKCRAGLLIQTVCEIAFRIFWLPTNFVIRSAPHGLIFSERLIMPIVFRIYNFAAEYIGYISFTEFVKYYLKSAKKECKNYFKTCFSIFKKILLEETTWDTLSHLRQAWYGKKEIICFSPLDKPNFTTEKIRSCARSTESLACSLINGGLFKEIDSLNVLVRFLFRGMYSTRQAQVSQLYFSAALTFNNPVNCDCISSLVNLNYFELFSGSIRPIDISPLLTNLRCLPSINYLYLRNLLLTSLPPNFYDLPSSLTVYLGGNPLSDETLNALNQPGRQGPIVEFDMADHHTSLVDEPLKPLNAYLEAVYKSSTYAQRLLQFDENDTKTLRIWLSKRVIAKDYRNNPGKFDLKVKEFLDWLSEETDETKIRQAFVYLDNAVKKCCDLYSITFNDLSLLRREYKNFDELKKLIITFYIMDLIDKIAKEKIMTLQAYDAVEVHLGYQVNLNKTFDLQLPIDDMQFVNESKVKDPDIKDAEQRIREKTEGKENQLKILSDHYLWKAEMEKLSQFKVTEKACKDAETRFREEFLNDKEDPTPRRPVSQLSKEELEKQEAEDAALLKRQELHCKTFVTNSDTIWNPYWVLTKDYL